MSSYQTARLEEYNPCFLAVAQDLFDRVRREIPEGRTKKYPGSFSIFGQRASDTAAKIVIYESRLGRTSRDWPDMSDGVYVWIRANGSLGDDIWGDALPAEIPWLFERIRRDRTVQIAANNQADFAYLPVMAGDDLGQLASLLIGCSRY